MGWKVQKNCKGSLIPQGEKLLIQFFYTSRWTNVNFIFRTPQGEKTFNFIFPTTQGEKTFNSIFPTPQGEKTMNFIFPKSQGEKIFNFIFPAP